MNYRVIYGETVPAWDRDFSTRREANAFAKKQRECGDIVFGVFPVAVGAPPSGALDVAEYLGLFNQSIREPEGTKQ